MPVLSRGKLHVEVFGEEFPGECAQGAQQMVEKLASILSIRFPNQAKPKIVMTDRGRGFFSLLLARSQSNTKLPLRVLA